MHPVNAIAIVFAALMASAAAAPATHSPGELAKRLDCSGHISVTCNMVTNQECCSWTCDATGAVLLIDCETGGPGRV
jgi:hypothetical protein